MDRFGRTQTFHREAAGEFSGEITGVTDGAGRHFRLVLTTQAQRAEEARQQAISGGTEPSAFPDTLPGYTEYGRDNGIRLSAVWLTHDPEYPENLPAAPLVRYGWTPRGELAVVYDRSGKQVRSFTYDDKYRGRMVAHRHTGRPEICYRYDSDGRVTEQLNPAGLNYTYQYEKDRITITDSLDRREVLHTQGEAGLKRVVKKEHADGSVTQSQFDAVAPWATCAPRHCGRWSPPYRTAQWLSTTQRNIWQRIGKGAANDPLIGSSCPQATRLRPCLIGVQGKRI